MSEWQFLLDENIDPKVTTYLNKEGLSADHVLTTLGQGADDEDDILPYARENNLIIVTSDVTDFGSLPNDAHAGVVLLYDDTMPAYKIASALIGMVDAYQNRDAFEVREKLDGWA